MSRRGVFVTGAIGSIATPWLFFLCFNAHSLLWAFVGYLIIFIPFCLHYGALPAFFAGAFPAEIRYTGVSLALSIGTVLGSGLSPLIATALLGTDNNWTAVAIFISALAAAGALAILAIREQPETTSASN
jgi:MFS family permease